MVVNCKPDLTHSHCELIEKLFSLEGIPYEKITDVDVVMTASQGTVSPGTVMVKPLNYPDCLFTIYDAVSFIEQNGLKRCI